MKKIVLALVTTSAFVSQAAADVRSGFYVGETMSVNSLALDGKTSYREADTATPSVNPTYFSKTKPNSGKFGLGAGVYAGYGMVSGCMYYAGELAYNYNGAQTKSSSSSNFTSFIFDDNDLTQNTRLKIENEHTFNFAALIGTKLTPSTVLYVRIGGNVSKIEMKASIFAQHINKNKTRLSFAPGFGVETSMHKNWVARLEYSYDLGQGVSKSKTLPDPVGLATRTQTFKTHIKHINTHSVKFGIAYRI